jgi:hypothetical protein
MSDHPDLIEVDNRIKATFEYVVRTEAMHVAAAVGGRYADALTAVVNADLAVLAHALAANT